VKVLPLPALDLYTTKFFNAIPKLQKYGILGFYLNMNYANYTNNYTVSSSIQLSVIRVIGVSFQAGGSKKQKAAKKFAAF
jgi:hypothetical protein